MNEPFMLKIAHSFLVILLERGAFASRERMAQLFLDERFMLID